MAILKNSTINDTGFLGLPSGTRANRPVTPNNGQLRNNTDSSLYENYSNSSWKNNNSNWIITETFRTTPGYIPQVLIQAESAGSNNNAPGRRQFIQIDGTTVLAADAPRSYRVTKLRKPINGNWTYIASNGYDVYGSQSDADAARTFLEGFVEGEMLILNTWDEPESRRIQLAPVLTDSFGSSINAFRARWNFRDSHLLISIKGYTKPLFEQQRPAGIAGPAVSMWLS